jgi:polyisoprenyl-phosphate glycosyltransferase
MSGAGAAPIGGKDSADPAPPQLSVVAPCFNEADGLMELHRRLSAACADVVADAYEIVLVDDGSVDATALVFAELARRDRHFVGVGLSRNYGHQLALTAGLWVCRGDRALIIDADLQDPPELLGAMMALMDEGADVVYGQRIARPGESWRKRATAGLFYRALRSLSDVDIPLDSGDFRLMNRRSLAAFLAMPEAHRFVRGMVSWIGFKQVALPYERAERFRGRTKYPLRKMLGLALDAITGFSVRPLRLANYLSLLLAICSLLILGYALYQWSADATVRAGPA